MSSSDSAHRMKMLLAEMTARVIGLTKVARHRIGEEDFDGAERTLRLLAESFTTPNTADVDFAEHVDRRSREICRIEGVPYL